MSLKEQIRNEVLNHIIKCTGEHMSNALLAMATVHTGKGTRYIENLIGFMYI